MGRERIRTVRETKVFGKGKTTIPKEIVREFGIVDEDHVVWLRVDGTGTIVVKPPREYGKFRPITP